MGFNIKNSIYGLSTLQVLKQVTSMKKFLGWQRKASHCMRPLQRTSLSQRSTLNLSHMNTEWNNTQLTPIGITLQLGCDKFNKFSNGCNSKCITLICLPFAISLLKWITSRHIALTHRFASAHSKCLSTASSGVSSGGGGKCLDIYFAKMQHVTLKLLKMQHLSSVSVKNFPTGACPQIEAPLNSFAPPPHFKMKLMPLQLYWLYSRFSIPPR